MEQASSLIFRGKTHAARGDYRLERIIAVMEHLSDVAQEKAIRSAISREEEVRQQTLGVEAREEIAERFIPPPEPTQTLIPPPAPTQTLIPPSTPQQTIPLFIEERQVDSFKRGGREIPIVETVVVDLQGNVVRKASAEEVRTFQARPSVLEEERTRATTPTGLLLERTASAIRRKKREISQRGEGIGREIGGVGLGVAGVVVGTAVAIPQIISSPIQTIKSVPTQIAIGKEFVTSGQLSQQIVQNPGLVTGVIAGEVIIARGLGRVVQVPTQAIARRVLTPKAESIVSVSLERQVGLRGQAIIGFETVSGRVGTIRQISKIDDLTKTIGVGQIAKQKFDFAGDIKLVKPQAIIGEVISKAKRTPVTNIIEEIGGVKVGREIFGEVVVGKGRVSISPREKFFSTRMEITPRLKSRIFLERVKGIKTLDFTTKAFVVPVGTSGRLKFVLGGTKAEGIKPAGFGAFVFRLKDLKVGGDKLALGMKTPKTFKILTPEQKILFQKQATKQEVDLLSIASAGTTTFKTLKVKALPSIKGTIQTPTLETKRLGITSQAQTISPIQKVKQDIKIKTTFATIQTPKTIQAITPTTKQKITTVTKQIQQIKQTQQIKTLARVQPAVRQRQDLRQRQLLIATTITSPPTRFPIPISTPILAPLIPFRTRSRKALKISTATFGVSIRRFGKFRTIGKGLSLTQALGLGRERVATTLGATFRLTPTKKGTSISQNIPTPKGFKRKKGLIFIEAPRFRLSRRGEVQEIQIARRLKV